MTKVEVGSIASLWRYPVKSMLGQNIERSVVTTKGLLGDRSYALLDVESGKIASAKYPKKWAKLLDFRARLPLDSQLNDSVSVVEIILPDETSISSDNPKINQILSNILEKQVELISISPENANIDQYWPKVEGTAHQETVTQIYLPSGTFFDSCFIHGITTATLDKLQELFPQGQFKPQRFRPNLVIESVSQEIDFIENNWLNGVLAIGDKVKLSIDTLCPRCVVTTLAQGDLPNDLNILRTAALYNNVIAGIRTSILQVGHINQGDPIWLEK